MMYTITLVTNTKVAESLLHVLVRLSKAASEAPASICIQELDGEAE